MKWTNRDMLAFARVASAGSYGAYEGCNTLEKKLSRYKKLKKKAIMNRYSKELEKKTNDKKSTLSIKIILHS